MAVVPVSAGVVAMSATAVHAGPPAPMELVYDLSLGSTFRPLDVGFTLLGTVNVTVDWGDSNTENVSTSGVKTHTYASVGTYTVKITGSLDSFLVAGTGSWWSAPKLTSVTSFGDLGLTSLEKTFQDATNLTSVPSTLPSTVTNLGFAFSDADKFNGDLSGWNVSNVTNMHWMFDGAKSFNRDISSWDVSNVTTMQAMFKGATSFNQDISNWDVSSVTTMNGMFQSNPNFNSDISDWNVSSVTDMSNMFADFSYSGVKSKFNQDISKWDVSNVTKMTSMFENAKSFNQDISKWDVSKVDDMNSMFDSASSFNQPIGGWDTGNVTDMGWMFSSATAFDQDLGRWNVGKLTSARSMFGNVKLSIGNYDNLLISWARQAEASPGLKKNVPFNGGKSKYSCSAVEARRVLDVDNQWVMVDGGVSDVPGKPTITAIFNGDGKVEVQFDGPSCPDSVNVDNYQISVDGGDNWITLDPETTQGPLIITGLTNGTPYPILLRAVSSDGVGSFSNLRYGRPVGSGSSGGSGGGTGSGGSGAGGGTITVAVAKPNTTISGVLPKTGTRTDTLVMTSMVLILLGSGIVTSSHRRRRTTSRA